MTMEQRTALRHALRHDGAHKIEIALVRFTPHRESKRVPPAADYNESECCEFPGFPQISANEAAGFRTGRG
jgi:hypothetical protein